MQNHITTGINKTLFLQRSQKEKLINQHAKVLWFTGLSGSGKTTIAMNLEHELHKKGYLTQLFDGDIIRNSINKDLGFSIKDREENIRRMAEISKFFLYSGIIVINCFVSPTKQIRDLAKSIIGEEDFIEVYINASIETCEKRDTKGLYKKARNGEIKNFTGIDSPYEIPENPGIEIKSELCSVEQAVNKIIETILPKIKHN